MKIKKLLSLALCVGILLSCLFFTDEAPRAFGEENTVYESTEPVIPPESDFTYRKTPLNSPERVIITGYSGVETKIIVPEEIEGLPVTSIASTAFTGNEKITYIKLPASLNVCSGKGFSLCSSLTEIAVDENSSAFCSVDGVLYRKDTDEEASTYGKPISLIRFPAGKSGKFTVPYGIKSIGAYAFDHCYSLTEIDMYNTVTTVGANAFSFCWGLESIRLSDNLTSLGQEALAYCDALLKIDLPSKLTSIGTDAFLGGIDSDNNKFYYFIDGISCTKGSYVHQYLIDQALPESIITFKTPSFTDNDTGIQLLDAYGTFSEDQLIDICVNEVPLSEIEGILPTRYSSAYAFDISFTQNGEEYTPADKFILNFDSVCSDAIPSATKIYQQFDERLVLVSGTAHIPFIGAQSSCGGRFVILINNDFSLKGDIDGDGVVTLFDVKASLHASAGTLTLTAEQLSAADADNSGDGKITTEDARKILRLAGGMSIE